MAEAVGEISANLSPEGGSIKAEGTAEIVALQVPFEPKGSWTLPGFFTVTEQVSGAGNLGALGGKVYADAELSTTGKINFGFGGGLDALVGGYLQSKTSVQLDPVLVNQIKTTYQQTTAAANDLYNEAKAEATQTNNCASSSVLSARLRGRSVPPPSSLGENSAAGLLGTIRRRTPNAKMRRTNRSKSFAAAGARTFTASITRAMSDEVISTAAVRPILGIR